MRRSSLLAPLAAAALSLAWAPVPGNPADRLLRKPIEPSVYDQATHCVKTVPVGTRHMASWLSRHSRGDFWGALRCEKWGPHSASLHAEGRAIDWHLDVRSTKDRAAAQKLFRLLLAPDRAGNEQALARRMGVEELIWNCTYWGAGSPQFGRYSYCYDAKGKRKKRLNRTQAHMDHVHIGLTRQAAQGRTSFWQSAVSRR